MAAAIQFCAQNYIGMVYTLGQLERHTKICTMQIMMPYTLKTNSQCSKKNKKQNTCISHPCTLPLSLPPSLHPSLPLSLLSPSLPPSLPLSILPSFLPSFSFPHIERVDNGRYGAEEGPPGATEEADEAQHNGESEVMVS